MEVYFGLGYTIPIALKPSLRRLAAIKYPKIAPGFGSDLADSIEASPAHPAPEALAPPWASQNRRNSTATSRILRLRIGQRRPKDGMRDGILYCDHAPKTPTRGSDREAMRPPPPQCSASHLVASGVPSRTPL
jgi:hypothetical protein